MVLVAMTTSATREALYFPLYMENGTYALMVHSESITNPSHPPPPVAPPTLAGILQIFHFTKNLS